MKILLADDQKKVRFALRVLLDRKPELSVIGEAGDADELLALSASTQVDVLIMDWLLPGLPEGGSIEGLRVIRPGLFVIALSGRPEFGRAAIEAGADAFVSKIDPPDRLLAIIDQFHERIDHARQTADLS